MLNYQKVLSLLVVLVIICWSIESFAAPAQPPQTNKDADALEQTARTYLNNKQYAEAEQVYQTIILQYPKTDYALSAYQGLASLYIEWDKIQSAEEITKTLINKFSKHQDLPKALYLITERYEQLDKFEDAKNNYEQIIQNYPNSEWAGWALLGISRTEVKSLISSGNYDQAQKTIVQLSTDFAAHPNLPETLYSIAWVYRWANRQDTAKNIYQIIIQNYPDSPVANKAKAGILREEIMSLISAQDYPGAQKALDKLITQFSSNSDLPETLYWIAETYRWVGKHEEAKNLHQRIVRDYPDSSYSSRAKLGISREEIISLILSQNYPGAQKVIDRMVADFAGNPDLPGELYWFAETYRWSGRHEEAKNLYQRIVQHYPNSTVASKSKLGISREEIMSLISAQDYPGAQKALDKLITQFSSNPDLPGELYWFAETYRWSDKFEDAKRIYQQIAQNYPGSSYASRAKLGITREYMISFIMSQKFDQAKETLNKMTVDFAGNPDLPDALYWIAQVYEWSDKTEEAKNIYQQVIQKYPDSSYTSRAKLGFSRINVMSLIQSQNYDQAEEAFDKLIADFPGNSDLAETFRNIGFAYYTKARLKNLEGDIEGGKELYRKAIQMWERVINEFPNSVVTPQAYYSSAVCYAQELGEEQKGIDYFQKVADKWPYYEYAWNAQYSVGTYYETLMNSGTIPQSEALPKIEKAYTAVVEKYPDCEVAENALLRLGQINFANGKFFESAMYFEMLLEKKPQEFCNISADLIKAYEKMGNTEMVSIINSRVEKNCSK